MLKIHREWRERRKIEKYYSFGHTKIIGPRPLGGGGGRRVRPPGSASEGLIIFLRAQLEYKRSYVGFKLHWNALRPSVYTPYAYGKKVNSLYLHIFSITFMIKSNILTTFEGSIFVSQRRHMWGQIHDQ